MHSPPVSALGVGSSIVGAEAGIVNRKEPAAMLVSEQPAKAHHRRTAWGCPGCLKAIN